MAFATDSDLEDMISTIFDHGLDTFASELAKAEDDVVRKIKIEWFNKRYNPNTFNKSLLIESQWTNATVYRALGFYIMPKLSQWREDGDSFQEQMEFYQERFAEEMNDQFGVGIEYDYDEDGSIDNTEPYQNSQSRLYR